MSYPEGHVIHLDHLSNVKIFEKLATSHLVDARKIDEIKHANEVSDLPIGRKFNVRPMPEEPKADSDSISSIINEGVRKHLESSSSAASSPKHYSERISGQRFDNEERVMAKEDHEDNYYKKDVVSNHGDPFQSPGPQRKFPFSQFTRSPGNSRPTSQVNSRNNSQVNFKIEGSPRETFRETSRETFRNRENSRENSRDNSRENSVARVDPPPLPTTNDEEREFQRIHAFTSKPAPQALTSMRQRFDERERAPTMDGEKRSSYTKLYRSMCMSRDVKGEEGQYAPSKDSQYSQKREIIMKLDELRHMGFNVPKLDHSMPLEDLQAEFTRRTISMDTVANVDQYIDWICKGAAFFEMINNATGPFIPLENYSQNVRAATQTPRFRYALYQLIMRYSGGSGGSSPFKVILLALLMPIIQGLVVKFIQFVSKGKYKATFMNKLFGNGFQNIQKLFSTIKGEKDKSDDIPAGIPGISVPEKPATMDDLRQKHHQQQQKQPPQQQQQQQQTNPFANFPLATPTVATPNVARKRMKLQRPDELMSDLQSNVSSGVILTAAQRESGLHRV